MPTRITIKSKVPTTEDIVRQLRIKYVEVFNSTLYARSHLDLKGQEETIMIYVDQQDECLIKMAINPQKGIIVKPAKRIYFRDILMVGVSERLQQLVEI